MTINPIHLQAKKLRWVSDLHRTACWMYECRTPELTWKKSDGTTRVETGHISFSRKDEVISHLRRYIVDRPLLIEWEHDGTTTEIK